jgi:hypothetical protein
MDEPRAVWPRLALAAAIGIAAVAFVLGVLDVRVRALNSDFTVFTIAGAAFFDGRDPYAIENPQGWHYAYPPLFALLVSPLARLDFPAQVTVWFAISFGLAALCAAEAGWIIRAIRRQEGVALVPPPPWWIIAAAIPSILLPTIDTLQRGQVALALTWPLLLGLRLALSARGWLMASVAGVVLALPIAIKLTPIVPVAALVLVARRSGDWSRLTGARSGFGLALGAGVVAGLALFLLVMPAAPLGWRGNVAHLETWARRIRASAEVGVDNNKFTFRNQSFANAVEMLARWEHPKSPLRWILPRDPGGRDLRAAPRVPRSLLRVGVPAIQLLLSALVVAASWRLGSHGSALGAAAAFGLASALSLVISPISWAHHFVILLPAVLFVPWWFWAEGRPTAARWLAAVPPALTGIHYLLIDTGWVERPFGLSLSLIWTVGLLGVGTAGWCMAAAGLALAGPATSTEKFSADRAR